jgi:hypothetical protein
MLLIRAEQMKTMEAERANAFVVRLKADLRAALGRVGRAISEEDLDRQLELGLPRGYRYFKREADVARYAMIVMLQVGGWSEQDDPETLLRMLGSRTLSADRRLRNLEIWSRSREGFKVRRQRERK